MELRSIKNGDVMYYVYNMNCRFDEMPQKITVKSARTKDKVTVIVFENDNQYFGVRKAVGYYTGNTAVNDNYIFCTSPSGFIRTYDNQVKASRYDDLLRAKESIEYFLKAKL